MMRWQWFRPDRASMWRRIGRSPARLDLYTLERCADVAHKVWKIQSQHQEDLVSVITADTAQWIEGEIRALARGDADA